LCSFLVHRDRYVVPFVIVDEEHVYCRKDRLKIRGKYPFQKNIVIRDRYTVIKCFVRRGTGTQSHKYIGTQGQVHSPRDTLGQYTCP